MSTGLLYDGGVGGVPPDFKGPTGSAGPLERRRRDFLDFLF